MTKNDLLSLMKSEIDKLPIDAYGEPHIKLQDALSQTDNIGELFHSSNYDGNYYYALGEDYTPNSVDEWAKVANIEELEYDELVYLFSCLLISVKE